MTTTRKVLVVIVILLWALASTAQTPPTAIEWARASPADIGLPEAKLLAMSAAIRSDQFKKIGSVLIARHGKLVYEDYVATRIRFATPGRRRRASLAF